MTLHDEVKDVLIFFFSLEAHQYMGVDTTKGLYIIVRSKTIAKN